MTTSNLLLDETAVQIDEKRVFWRIVDFDNTFNLTINMNIGGFIGGGVINNDDDVR